MKQNFRNNITSNQVEVNILIAILNNVVYANGKYAETKRNNDIPTGSYGITL